jgi:hypothetical protein
VEKVAQLIELLLKISQILPKVNSHPSGEKSSKQVTLIGTNRQGDQIGRIFAYWEIENFGQLFSKITEAAKIRGATLFPL